MIGVLPIGSDYVRANYVMLTIFKSNSHHQWMAIHNSWGRMIFGSLYNTHVHVGFVGYAGFGSRGTSLVIQWDRLPSGVSYTKNVETCALEISK